MPEDAARYPRYRFPPAIISYAVWLDYRFALSFRDVEDVLAQRGSPSHRSHPALVRDLRPLVRNLFSVGRHQLRAAQQRLLRSRAFGTWNAVAAA
jgi:hypothetical protein